MKSRALHHLSSIVAWALISGAKEFTQRTGWVDLSHGLRARQLPDGRYCLTQEENFHSKVLVILWTPSV